MIAKAAGLLLLALGGYLAMSEIKLAAYRASVDETASPDTDVDVLAEDGELLGQVAVALVQGIEALAGADAPVRPAMEGVGAAAADGDVVPASLGAQDVAQAGQVAGDAVHAALGQGADLDHALGDFELDVALAAIGYQAAQQIGGGAG